MKARSGLVCLLLGVCLASPAWSIGADDEPSFNDLIKNNSFIRSLGEKPPTSSTVPVVRGPSAPATTSNEADQGSRTDIDRLKALVTAKDFAAAATLAKQLQQREPRRAQFRYYLAYVYYRASQEEWAPEKRKAFVDAARDEAYRTFDLAGDRSNSENPVWIANAEVLFNRLNGVRARPIPPVHGRLMTGFTGSGGIMLGNVLARDGRVVYNIAGKPVASFGQGVVEHAGNTRDLGLTMRVRYHDARGQSFVVTYGFLKDTNDLRAGMTVEPNTVLGHVGTRGGGQEPALYVQIQANGRDFDPAVLMSGAGSRGERF